MMEPHKLVMENGYWPQHDPKKAGLSRVEADANRAWFAGQWDQLVLGGVMNTRFGFYLKTARGFRRCSKKEGEAAHRRSKQPQPIIKGNVISVPFSLFHDKVGRGYKWTSHIDMSSFYQSAEQWKLDVPEHYLSFDIDEWYMLNDEFAETIDRIFGDEQATINASIKFLCAYYNTHQFELAKVSRVHIIVPAHAVADHRMINIMVGIAGDEFKLPDLPRVNVWRRP